MLKIVLKFLVVVIVIAIPISCKIVNYWGAPSIKKNVESFSDFEKLCGNASDTVLDRNERLYQEYEKCVNDKVDTMQLNEDIDSIVNMLESKALSSSTLTNQENSMLVAAIKKYCPNANSVLKCTDILFPIFSECLTDEHRESVALTQRLKLRILDFFCQKDAVHAIQLIDEKFFDCMNINIPELEDCEKKSKRQFKKSKVDDNEDNFPMESEICRFTENLANCFIPKIEQCELSTNIGALVKSFSNYIQSDVCTSFTNVTSSPTRLE